MRILLANANTTQAITERCAAVARLAAGRETEIVAVTADFGPAVISTRVEDAIAAHGILDCLARNYSGCDAVVLAVSLDTALNAARQLLPVPVVGMTEAGCLLASLVGARFGLVTFGKSTETYRELLDREGFSSRCMGMRAVDLSPAEALSRPEQACGLIGNASQELIEQGAEAILLAGAALAGMGSSLDLPVPVVDGIACATKLAEALVSLGFKKPSSGSHVALQARRSVGLSPQLRDLLMGDPPDRLK